MADLIFRISPNIVLGSYTSTRIGQFAKDYGSRFMVILDPNLKESGISDKILQSLDERNIDYFTFNEIPTCADTKTIEAALSLAKESHAQAIIAVGGGKAINCGRAVSSIFNSTKTIHDIIDSETQTVIGNPMPMLALLTTSRDPFVYTNRVPVVDSRSKKIKLLKCQNEICKITVFDPNLFSSLTDNQNAAMELETMCLCVEAYSSQKATFFSDMLVEKATEILGYALNETESLAMTTPQEVLLGQAGCMASLASGSSSLGAASLLALSINSRFGISRSLIAAILLPYVIEDVKNFKSEKLEKLEKLMNVSNLAENMRSRLAKANLPTRLKDLNISVEQLALAAEDAGELDLINSLPRSMTADDLFELIKTAY